MTATQSASVANGTSPARPGDRSRVRRGGLSRLNNRARALAGLVALAMAGATAAPIRAQVAPNLKYRTIATRHFHVVFAPGLEDVARRAAGSAERAYEALSRELHPPRGPITIVVADNLDTSNGYATTFPTNRIVIYARPNVDANSLKFIDDWVDLVVTHELAHIFHLDRSRGIWRLGQYVFGRNPSLFPNAYAPNWIAEGLAVHYESKLTGAGRDAGTDFDATARAHALAGIAPRANGLSAATPRYPLGNIVYTYGTPLIGAAASRGGDGAMRKFVDVSAGRLIPYMINSSAQRAFGTTFPDAYARWADSTAAEAKRLAADQPALTPIVPGGWFSTRPRWLDDSTLVWAGADPRSVPSLRQVSVAGGPVRVVGVRNTNDVASPVPGGWRVFAQQEYTDPYTYRTDLYVEKDGAVRRLTTGARLTQPDARICDGAAGGSPVSATAGMPDLCVLAVQLTPGASRLVHVRVTGGDVAITPLTEASDSVVWSEPRWARRGDRVAATRWHRGGLSGIAVLDASGRSLALLGRSRAVNASPSWDPGDSTIVFTSDRSGRSAIYRAHVARGTVVRIADSPTALYEAEVSPDGRRVATFALTGDGLSLAVLPADGPTMPADSASVLPPARGMTVARSDAAVRGYAALPWLLPRYWTPQYEAGYENAARFGLFTGGSDLVDRHAWQLSATHDPTHDEPEYDGVYQFSGFGQPVLTLGTSQVWDHPGVPDSARTRLLPVARRRQFADLSASVIRRRYRTALSLTAGARYEWRDFRALDGVPFSRLSPANRAALALDYTYPSYFVSGSFSNARVPYLALGPENGFTAAATVRQRWRSDAAAATRATSVVGTLAAYRALDFGGPIHHLLAVRVAAATQDATSASEFSAGGNSGGVVEIVPGFNFGDGRRTFFVRGFDASSQVGSKALGGTVEYRVPIALPARGWWRFPVFFQRVSGVVFADAGAAWCPTGRATSPICPRTTAREWMSSAGAELHFDTAVQYDVPYRFRLGVATPVSGRAYGGGSRVYATLGLPF